MKIGVAKGLKADEYRVALTPAGARELVQRGHDVTIETGAGDGSAFPDSAYEAAGARIAAVEDVWSESELLLKVKEPVTPEYGPPPYMPTTPFTESPVTDLWDLCLWGATRFRELFAAVVATAPIESDTR